MSDSATAATVSASCDEQHVRSGFRRRAGALLLQAGRFRAGRPPARGRTAVSSAPGRNPMRLAGGLGLAADFLDQPASPLLRRSTSVRGKESAGHSCRDRACSRIRPVASPSKSPSSRLRQRRQRRPAGRARIAQIRPRSAGLTWPERGQLSAPPRSRLPLDGRLADLRPHHLFRNPRLVRQPVRKLVTGRGIRNPGRDRQHRVQELPPAVVLREIVPGRRAIEQIFQIWPRIRAVFPGTRPAPCFLMNLSGSSPAGSIATLTWNPSATSSSDERAAAPCPAASGSKLRTTFDANRFSSLACAGVSAVPDEATTLAIPAWNACAKSKYPFDHHRVLRLGDGGLAQVQAVERPALDINRRLG